MLIGPIECEIRNNLFLIECDGLLIINNSDFKFLKIRLTQLKVNSVFSLIPELGAEVVHIDEEPYGKPRCNIYHGPLKGKKKQKTVEQAIKIDLRESITAEHQKCTVDFFLNITGNETENRNILILLYCYKTTLLEVLQ